MLACSLVHAACRVNVMLDCYQFVTMPHALGNGFYINALLREQGAARMPGSVRTDVFRESGSLGDIFEVVVNLLLRVWPSYLVAEYEIVIFPHRPDFHFLFQLALAVPFEDGEQNGS